MHGIRSLVISACVLFTFHISILQHISSSATPTTVKEPQTNQERTMHKDKRAAKIKANLTFCFNVAHTTADARMNKRIDTLSTNAWACCMYPSSSDRFESTLSTICTTSLFKLLINSVITASSSWLLETFSAFKMSFVWFFKSEVESSKVFVRSCIPFWIDNPCENTIKQPMQPMTPNPIITFWASRCCFKVNGLGLKKLLQRSKQTPAILVKKSNTTSKTITNKSANAIAAIMIPGNAWPTSIAK